MENGKVKWFNNAKGYGFVVADGRNEDLFAHYSAIQMDGYRTLKLASLCSSKSFRDPRACTQSTSRLRLKLRPQAPPRKPNNPTANSPKRATDAPPPPGYRDTGYHSHSPHITKPAFAGSVIQLTT